MILEIDTNFLIQHKITAHQYLLLEYARADDYEGMKKYLQFSKEYDNIQKSLDVLESCSFILPITDPYPTFRNLKPSAKYIKLMTFTGDPFDEFYELFPIKVLRPDGNYDYLRVNKDRCRKLYHNITKLNKSLHDHLIKCLAIEISDRTNTGTLGFMKRMSTWLSSEQWKNYEDKEKSVSSINTERRSGYGTEIE